MELPERLNSVLVKTYTGELIINGELLQDVSGFTLDFHKGEWNISLSQIKRYSTAGKSVSNDMAKE